MASGCLVWRKDLIPARAMGRDGDVLALGGVGGNGRIRHGIGLDITKSTDTVTSSFKLTSDISL